MTKDEQIAYPVKILVVEDNPADVRLVEWSFSKTEVDQYELTPVGTLDKALKCLDEESFDLVLLDLGLPDSQGLDTFEKMKNECPEVPVVILSGLDDESLALRAVRKGAQDYLVKGQSLLIWLVHSIKYAIERHKLLAQIKTLRGLLPICSSCKKIRDDAGYWNEIEQYVKEHSEADFSHSFCPDCMKKLYPETYSRKFGELSKHGD